ncbi:MAG TPA: CCA tRNA nucleotidyltransferase [Alphaproteobacteria bacterium]|nr:CCA tRNA nucleotidyltransferase [Alphaproteobacteria bacterium]
MPDPARRLPDQPWINARETRAVIEALTRDRGQARFVGGCVRDAWLGRTVKDIDIATPDPPDVVMQRLTRAGIRAIPTGIEHGTVTAVIGDRHFEITTLRRDVETFGRRARVAFTDDWEADAARRDLTINALSADPDGTVHDPFGGIDDLEAGRVRFVGDPEARIREDVLRLLRFFRFHAWYGKADPDEAGLDACSRLAELLPTLSGERVATELLRLLLAPDPASALELMRDHGVLRPILPELTEIERLRMLVLIEDEIGDRDAVRRLAALLPQASAAALAVAARLKLSNVDRDRLAALAAPPISVKPPLNERAWRRALHRLGVPLFRDLVLLDWADSPGTAPRHRELLAAAAAWTPVVLPLKGQDVLDHRVAAGPEVGHLLAEIERWWEEGDYRATREDCLSKLKALISARRVGG